MATDLATSEVDRLFKEGQAAARNGDMAAARTLLTQVVERDPHNERAWMWLSGVVAEPEEQQICLENVLVINPNNTKARKALDYISAKTGISPSISGSSGSSTDTSTEPLSSDFSVFGDNSLALLSGLSPLDASQFAPSAPDPSLMSAPMGATDFGAVPAWEQPKSVVQPDASPFGAPMQWATGGGAEAIPAPVLQFSDPADVSFASVADGFAVHSQSLGESSLPTDVQPFSIDAALSTAPEPTPYAHDTAASLPADSGLPPWSIDPRVPAFDGSSILQLDDSDLLQGMPAFHDADMTRGAVPHEPGTMQAMNVGPAGPLSGAELPQPTDLPGFNGALGDASQPWYLQAQDAGPKPTVESGAHSGYAVGSPDQAHSHMSEAEAKAASATMIECPNCREKSSDTSMACPNCYYSFFVNCPHCHELIDVSDARSGAKEPCPQCNTEINRMDLGLRGISGGHSYQSTPLKGSMVNTPAMQTYGTPSPDAQRRPTFNWVVDVVWLVVIVASVWALTQLPTWMHWTGQY